MINIGTCDYRRIMMLAAGISLAFCSFTGCHENRAKKTSPAPREYNRQAVVSSSNNAIVKVLSLFDPRGEIQNGVLTRDEMAAPLSRDPQYSSGYAAHIGNGVYLTATHVLKRPHKFVAVDTGRVEIFYPVKDYLVLEESDIIVFRSIKIDFSLPLSHEIPSILEAPVRISLRSEYVSGGISAVMHQGENIHLLTEPYGRPGMSGCPVLDENGSILAVFVGNMFMYFGGSETNVYGNSICVYSFLEQITSF